jgi:signal transduction histidine kinase
VPLIIAFGTVLVRGYRLAAYTVLALGYGAFLWLVPAVTAQDYPSGWAIVGLAAWLLLLAAVAELVRNRRAYLYASRQRMLEAQRSRDEQVRRQTSEQRLGIARELHDVLAHSISMINVQAGVALELMEQQPEQARTALTAIKQASKEALVEVQGVLDSLRGVDEDAPLVPAPTLADLDSLIERARVAGLVVRTETTGQHAVLPAAVDRAAFRIVQEALTNVVRHADATAATIHLDYGAEALRVRVDDNGRAPAPPPGASGNGLTGMRERATALGGKFSATPRSAGGFRVTAQLPIGPDGTA